MDDHSSHPQPPHHASGPFETEYEARASVEHILSSPTEAMTDGNHRLLEDACRAAGVELGAWDHRILVWLAKWEPSTVAVVAGLITRARQPTARQQLLGEPGVAQAGGGWVSGPST
jgi:hypothetical protein